MIDNKDPLKLGRITAQVPDVLGDEASTWALPCLPFTGRQAGQYVVPADRRRRVDGVRAGGSQLPHLDGELVRRRLGAAARRAAAELPGSQPVVIQTPGDHKLVMSDVPGGTGILLEAKGGAYIQIDEKGVTIGNGKGASIVLIGDEVNINEGRLIVPKKR